MDNDLLIIIYRFRCQHMYDAMDELIEHLSDLKHHMHIDMNRDTIIIADRIHIMFRCGDIHKLAGLRPDYYQTKSLEASTFLAQSASKFNERRGDSLNDIADIIRKEMGGKK